MKTKLKLGTRKSVLALTQSQWVADQIQKRNSDIEIELKGIVTEGDQDQTRPLVQMQGSAFFTKALEDALLNGDVDFVVHSLKDVSLERPKGIMTVAVPQREDPRDVVIFRKGIESGLQKGLKKIRVGTSSPRREANTIPFLKKVIPGFPEIEVVNLRGNVPTRLQKDIDAVILAAAGIERLWRNTEGRKSIAAQLRGRRKMVLPIRENPTAPGQGALAIECLASRTDIIERLTPLHDPVTADAVKREREVLEAWGGGCHLPLGATTTEFGLWIRGIQTNGIAVHTSQRPPMPSLQGLPKGQAFVSKPMQEEIKSDKGLKGVVLGLRLFKEKPLPIPENVQGQNTTWVLAGHARAIPEGSQPDRLWVGGARSWGALAKRGIWVEGCFEGLGEIGGWKALEKLSFLAEGSKDRAWVHLTHTSEAERLKQQQKQVVASYQLLPISLNSEQKTHITQSKHFYWTSASAFEALQDLVPAGSTHACGLGKSAAYLMASLGTDKHFVGTFLGVEEWLNWIKPILE